MSAAASAGHRHFLCTRHHQKRHVQAGDRTFPNVSGDAEVCCHCGATSKGGTFIEEREPTFQWPFCSKLRAIFPERYP